METRIIIWTKLYVLKNTKFDVSVSDVVFPGLKGFDLAEKVKEAYTDMKVDLVSGYNTQLNQSSTFVINPT